MCDRKSMKLEELHLARRTPCDSLRPPYKEVDHVQIRSSWVATHSVAFLPRLVLALGLSSGQTLHSWNRGPWLCAASDKEAGRSALAISMCDLRTRGNPGGAPLRVSAALRRSSVYGCRHPGARHWESAHQQRMQGLDRAHYTMHVLPL